MGIKKTELKCYVMVTGIKARCRKVSNEMIVISNYPLGTTYENVQVTAIERVNQVMKRVDHATIHLDLVEIETVDGINFESWIMFDSRHKKQVLVMPNTVTS
jgi:protein gp37